ncbi:ferrous iron transport protein A [Brumimicrobium salinarum]|uniref:Ferrous iron transport protein A n=1 Tax=Brumimicrobium salinarum TaxID=2058658 RepID=A0A2I0R3A0_9FLAO|nr:FeoA family protein [Brumimicrobium salinarum]PKR81062.1 ferrous iron transport protein A [Brumimicrobium salinarum]
MEKTSIATLKKGARGIITEIKQSEVSQRLIEMGLTPGTSFQIRSISPFGDPIAIRLNDFAVSLRLIDALNIIVMPKS